MTHFPRIYFHIALTMLPFKWSYTICIVLQQKEHLKTLFYKERKEKNMKKSKQLFAIFDILSKFQDNNSIRKESFAF